MKCRSSQKVVIHLFHVARDHERGEVILGIMLRARSHDVALRSGQKDARTYSNVIEVGIIG